MTNSNQVPNDVYQNNPQSRSHLSNAHHQTQPGQMLLINPQYNPNNPLNNFNPRAPNSAILSAPQSMPGLAGNNQRFTNHPTNYPFTVNGSTSHHLEMNQMYHVSLNANVFIFKDLIFSFNLRCLHIYCQIQEPHCCLHHRSS